MRSSVRPNATPYKRSGSRRRIDDTPSMREAAEDSLMVEYELQQRTDARSWTHTKKVVHEAYKGSQARDADVVRAVIMPMIYEGFKGMPADEYDAWVRDMDDLFNDKGFDPVASEFMKGMRMVMDGDPSPMDDFDEVIATSANNTQMCMDMMQFDSEPTGAFGAADAIQLVSVLKAAFDWALKILPGPIVDLLTSFIVELAVIFVQNRRKGVDAAWKIFRSRWNWRRLLVQLGWNIAAMLVVTYCSYPVVGCIVLMALRRTDLSTIPSVSDMLAKLQDGEFFQKVQAGKQEGRTLLQFYYGGTWKLDFRAMIKWMMHKKQTVNRKLAKWELEDMAACDGGDNAACNRLGFEDRPRNVFWGGTIPAAEQLDNVNNLYEKVKENPEWYRATLWFMKLLSVAIPVVVAIMTYDDTVHELREKIESLVNEAREVKLVASQSFIGDDYRLRSVVAFQYMYDNLLLDMKVYFTVENIEALKKTDWHNNMQFFELQEVINSLLDDLKTLQNPSVAINDAWFRQLCATRSRMTPLLDGMLFYLSDPANETEWVDLGMGRFGLRGRDRSDDPCADFYPDPAQPLAGLNAWVVNLPPDVIQRDVGPDVVFAPGAFGGLAAVPPAPAAAAAAAAAAAGPAAPAPAGLGIWAAAAAAAAPGAAPAAAGSPDAEVDEEEEEGVEIDMGDVAVPGEEGGGYPEDLESGGSSAWGSADSQATFATADAAVSRREVLLLTAVSNAPTVDAAFAKLGL